MLTGAGQANQYGSAWARVVDMSMSIQCPACSQKLQAKAELAGKLIKCPACGHLFQATLPEAKETPLHLPAARPTPGWSRRLPWGMTGLAVLALAVMAVLWRSSEAKLAHHQAEAATVQAELIKLKMEIDLIRTEAQPQRLLLGKWDLGAENGKEHWVEFHPDGQVKWIQGMRSLVAKYQWIGDATIDLEFPKGESTETDRFHGT